MRIAVLGGGPGGLYFAALAKALDPSAEIRVWERNAADDTFGFGVVFSDETLGGIEHADPVIYARMAEQFARWDDIDIHYRGTLTTVGGQGFAAMSRKKLLQLLQERCAELGVEVSFGTEAPDVDALSADYDLVLACDGANSAVRTKYADVFSPSLELGHNKYMWLGTDLVFEAFKFYICSTPYGAMQVHGYPYDATGSTFIVEMHDEVWRRAGFAESASQVFPPGASDEQSVARVRELIGDLLQGHQILLNNSKWQTFATISNATWRNGNVVLLGDAAHTAHFSIGSGTKLAMEDALALAACLHEHPDVPSALAAYEAERRPVVLSTQRAARASLDWFESIGHYVEQPPEQFAFNIVTRSRRITYDNLRLRDPEFVAGMDAWFAGHEAARGVLPAVSEQAGEPAGRPPMFHPYRLGRLELANRVVVSPMDMYSADDGMPTDFHLVHLGARALGGAGLVMTEMVCVSPTGRITPGCAGIYTPEQERAWARVTGFVHERSGAKVGIQLGPLGPQGLDPADVGGHRPAAAGRQLADRRAVRGAVLAGKPGPARAQPGRVGRDHRGLRGLHPGRRAGRLRPARTALRTRLPALVVPVAAVEPAHRPLRRRARQPAALPARGVRRGARGLAGDKSDQRADLGDRLVRGRQRRRGGGANRPSLRRARRRRHSRLDRPGGLG